MAEPRMSARLLAGRWYALAALVAAGGADAQQPIVQFETDFYPRSSVARSLTGPVTEAEVVVVRGQLIIPLLIRGERTLFVPALSGSRVNVSVSPTDPTQEEPLEQLYDLDLNLVLVRSLSERWRLTLVMSPGIASDLRSIGAEHMTLQAAAVLTRTVRPALAWGVGVSVTNAFGEVLPVPVLALEWRGRQVRADILAPARAAFLWTPGDIIELGIHAEVDGNVYTLGGKGEFRDAVVRYSVINVGPVVTMKISPQIHLSVAGGASFNRRLEMEAGDGVPLQDATLERGAYLRAGLSVFPPATALDR